MYRRFSLFECPDFISGRIEKWNVKMICCSLVLFSIHAFTHRQPKAQSDAAACSLNLNRILIMHLARWGCDFLKSKIFAKQTLLPQKQYTLLSKTSAKNSYIWQTLRSALVVCGKKKAQRVVNSPANICALLLKRTATPKALRRIYS